MQITQVGEFLGNKFLNGKLVRGKSARRLKQFGMTIRRETIQRE